MTMDGVERIATGVGFTEGPVVTQDGAIVFVSIDHGALYRVRPGEKPEVVARTGGGPNGAVEASDGRIYVAQNGGTWPAEPTPGVPAGIQVVDADGSVEVVCDGMQSPNDLAFGPDGLLYVTDPTRNGRRDDGRIWRCDVATGEAELLVELPWYPNGIAFGLDDDAVYVADTGRRAIVRFALGAGLTDPEIVVQMTAPGEPDGFAIDAQGNFLVACPDLEGGGVDAEVRLYSSDGELREAYNPAKGRFLTNLALSPEGDLVMTNSTSGEVLRVPRWRAVHLPLHPFRDGRP